MLLTSGQISMTISSCIVFIFTSLLFLSGYVLQQQTVRSLQAAIRPPPPPPPAPISTLSPSPTSPSSAVAKPFGNPPGSRGHTLHYASSSSSLSLNSSTPAGGWARVAYVQLLRRHIHVCNAVMVFAELARQKSPARRVLLYPSVWDRRFAQQEQEEEQQQGEMGPAMETSMRLLRVAARRFDVALVPISPVLGRGEDVLDAAYPVAGLLSLTNFDQLIYFPPSGLLLDPSRLDALFDVQMNSSMLAFPGTTDGGSVIPPVLLVRPSMKAYHESISSFPAATYLEEDYLGNVSKAPPHIAPDTSRLIIETSGLHLQKEAFNSTTFLAGATYVRLSDPEIPGPEYDISREVFLRSRPTEPEPRKAWEELYELYRMRRMDVCGLDLEPVMRDNGHDTELKTRAEAESAENPIDS
ncbi:hypothetical protein MMC24_005677 [Lignoscripta atroalba]|nr:hypothetical protein [Lignoscripta atroalba]